MEESVPKHECAKARSCVEFMPSTSDAGPLEEAKAGMTLLVVFPTSGLAAEEEGGTDAVPKKR